ncbi:hypothetical protein CQW23_19537 [Capsicum baccatum]|uniref:Uncharacterized protein n=1 Tax=Capsicum baccatum TaxID=33114 RepID=A0A2G2W625_CAPBA|nr:hypothetical protein CQW23_19537 [Capsicum baccatum]
MFILLCHNGSYDDMVRRVIEREELDCKSSDVLISYLMNGREKIHLTFINNDLKVSLYMLDVAVDGSRPLLRLINIVAGSLITPPPYPTVDEGDLIEDESPNVHLMIRII